MENIRIQDDLYNHVNQEWLEQAVIPEDKPTTGGFADLADGVEKNLMEDFKTMSKSKEYPNVYLERTIGLYNLAKDEKKRNKQGIKPVLKTLAKIQKVTNKSQLNRNLKEFVLSNIPLPFEFVVETNLKDTEHHCVILQGPSTILPDTTYYNSPQKDAILGMWTQMAQGVLAYTPLTQEEQELYLKDTLAFDSVIATLVKSAQEWSEYTKVYNPMKTSKVCSLMKPLKMKKSLEDVFGFVPEEIIVADPRFLKGFKTLFNEETFTQYIHWAYVMKLLNSTSYLSEELRVLGGTYGRALSGVAQAPSCEKFAFHLASNVYSEPVGLYYGEKYFGEEAKKDVVEMVNEIVETYIGRMKKNSFLSDATKEKAILKLSTMKVKMGYPDKVDSKYDEIVFDGAKSLYEAMEMIGRARIKHSISELTKPVDRSRWVMPGHMVNACYNPASNDITFPAAILQAPFYSIKQTRSQNLGGIGAVIGHEISHAFDNNGAQCDEKGNLNNWWTKEDHKQFTKRTKAMIKEFDGIELPWGKVNGEFVVSENIADNGGMGCTLEIMGNMKEKSYEEYFINWAKVWCMKAKPEYLALIINIDVHSPAILRANMQPRNFPEWYETFNVKSTDKMYLAPSKRVTIW